MALSTDQSENVFRDIYSQVLKSGKLVSPRGQLVREVEDFTYVLPPYVRFPSFKARKLQVNYIKRELLWYLRGNRYDLSIVEHAKIWENMVEDGAINSNYGHYIFRGSGFSVTMNDIRGVSQFSYVVSQLARDKDTRRASFTILNGGHHSIRESEAKDYPCTYAVNFRIRDNKLNMSVHMRSQDAIYGMGNDAPAFSFIHEMVHVSLLGTYPELELGTYAHTADSFHVYERHFDMLKKIVNGDPYEHTPCPRIRDKKEVEHLLSTVHLTYPNGKLHWCHDSLKNLHEDSFKAFGHLYSSAEELDFSAVEGPFTSWLLSLENRALQPSPTI